MSTPRNLAFRIGIEGVANEMRVEIFQLNRPLFELRRPGARSLRGSCRALSRLSGRQQRNVIAELHRRNRAYCARRGSIPKAERRKGWHHRILHGRRAMVDFSLERSPNLTWFRRAAVWSQTKAVDADESGLPGDPDLHPL
jgi:hypothetical protein